MYLVLFLVVAEPTGYNFSSSNWWLMMTCFFLYGVNGVTRGAGEVGLAGISLGERTSLIFSDGRRKAIQIPALIGPWLEGLQDGPSHIHGKKNTEQTDTYLSVSKSNRSAYAMVRPGQSMALRLLTESSSSGCFPWAGAGSCVCAGSYGARALFESTTSAKPSRAQIMSGPVAGVFPAYHLPLATLSVVQLANLDGQLGYWEEFVI
ncbi:hypothetical protein B0T14DRAFT_220101 [Immersiella caudata]|uniref:Uncharacterized protein n=1 Tax=Immersiella caudata TaxID=314043 RepID=A0AA39WQW3_9PEZI|nr:hypothetical protein B0T14DRAFT_220101 [Immersiella caudata]